MMIGSQNLEDIEQLVIHCADTPNGYKRYTAEDIDSWHQQKGFRRYKKGCDLQHIGYHYVIHIDGAVVKGRELEEVGAHAAPYNHGTIGVCMIGRDKFTPEQWRSLKLLVEQSKATLPNLTRISGHRDLVYRRYCPGFDVNKWYYGNLMAPDENHIWSDE